jgi:hypothetical protein
VAVDLDHVLMSALVTGLGSKHENGSDGRWVCQCWHQVLLRCRSCALSEVAAGLQQVPTTIVL